MPPNDDIDSALDALLSGGWDEPAEPAPVVSQKPPVLVDNAPEYPPLPVKELPYQAPAPRKPSLAPVTTLPVPVTTSEIDDDDQEPQEARHALMNVGLLTDMASGRKTALEAAGAAGVTEEDVHDALASALHQMDPKEVAKALGIQAAEQQLKSGALYGAILNDLVQDMKTGRVKHETKVEVLKLLAKVGRLEPKEDKGVATGGGFVLNISMGAAPAQPITIDAV